MNKQVVDQMGNIIKINARPIGTGYPVYIVAEMSANHNGSFDEAVRIIRAAHQAGADAVKIQTYTPDTMTINCDKEYFQIKDTIWNGRNLYELYHEAHTPWDWQPRLIEIANHLELDLFSTPFDGTAVKFLEDLDVPCYKVASFELVDLALIEQIAATGKPIIMSVGMANLGEIDNAIQAARNAGAEQIALLKCTSAYPASPETMNLKTIPHLSEAFQVPVGLSDHTLGIAVPIAAVCLGACIIEKHFTLSRKNIGPDSTFSLEPVEFNEMVESIRTVEKALGEVNYEASQVEQRSNVFRRSLFFVEDVKAGEVLTNKNVRSIRPGNGLAPKYLKEILGRKAAADIELGTPVSWDLITREKQ